MNIIFISYQPYPFGMAGSKRIRLFAEHLALNNRVKILVLGTNNDRNPNAGTENNVEYEFLKFSRLQSFLSFSRIRNILKTNYKNETKNVLFFYDGIGLTNFLFVKSGRKLGYKIFTDVVEDYTLIKENASFLLTTLYKINRIFERHTRVLADGVIILSTRLKEKFLALGVNPEKLILIPISSENIGLDFEKKKVNFAPFNFVYSGSYGNKDGVDILISAFNEFSKGKTDVKLVLAGKINNKIAELIKGKKNIIFEGMIPDSEYYQFLTNADVLLMTRINSSYANAGFPFKLGEYLATGNPVIVTKVSDVELYLKDREDVLFAEPSNVNSLVNAFDFAFNNLKDCIKIGQNGKMKCKLFFNPKINGEKLERFIKGNI